jgi:hypothetical protein
MDLMEIGLEGVACINLAWDMDWWQCSCVLGNEHFGSVKAGESD